MRRLPGFLLAVLALSTLLGCLIWPFPTGELVAGRGRITGEYTAPLQVGVATREEVLLRLGEPDEVLEGGRILTYRWTEAKGYLAIYGMGLGAFEGRRALRLEFGPDARLVHLGFEHGAPEPRADPNPARNP